MFNPSKKGKGAGGSFAVPIKRDTELTKQE